MTTSSPGRHLAALLAAIVGLSLIAATPAHAAKRTFTDARGDVRTITLSEDELFSEDDLPVSSPSTTPLGDVLSTTIDHRRHVVVVKTRFASIRRAEPAVTQFRFQGSNKQRRVVLIDNMLRPRGETVMVRERTGRPVCGRAVRHRIDYRADTVRFAFPSRCIDNPKQVRMGAVTVQFEFAAPDEETLQVSYDDALRTGGEVDVVGTGYTPFVRRG